MDSYGIHISLEDINHPRYSDQHSNRTVSMSDTKEYDATHEDEDVDDMARMNVMSEAPMIGALRRRFLSKQVWY